MDFVIAFDSEYGATGEIATAIASEIAWFGAATLLEARSIDDLGAIPSGILIMGCPTQNQGVTPLMAALLAGPSDLTGRRFAAFDTRYHRPGWWSGSAASQIDRRLRRMGAVRLVQPASYFIVGAEGPLEPGQINLARDWAIRIGERAMLTVGSTS